MVKKKKKTIMIHIVFVNFIQLLYINPFSSTSKLLAISSNPTLHICYIMFFGKALGKLKEMGRSI